MKQKLWWITVFSVQWTDEQEWHHADHYLPCFFLPEAAGILTADAAVEIATDLITSLITLGGSRPLPRDFKCTVTASPVEVSDLQPIYPE